MPEPRTRRSGIVGRSEPLARLLSARRHSRRTGLTCHVVTGEPGVGRTTLLSLVCRPAPSRTGPAVHIACSRHVNRLVTALTDALGPAADGHPAEEGEEGGGTAPPRARGSGGGPTGPRELVEALTRDAPLVIALDDVDQAGPESLVRLRGVLRDVAHLPVTLVVSTRSGEPAAAPTELADLLSGARTITLRGLSEQETGALMRERLGRRFDADLVTASHEITVGNPFLTRALCDWIRARESPVRSPAELRSAALPSVADAMIGRANRFHPRTRAVAEAVVVATASGEADPALVAHLSGTGLGETLAALDLLARMRLVTDDHAVTLRHPLLHTALLGSMTVMSRNAAHLAAADFLRRRPGAERRVARHLTESTVPLDAPWSSAALITAARLPDTAARDRVRYLEHAVQAGGTGAWPGVAPELAAARIALDRRGGLRATVEALGRTTDDAVRRRLLGLIGATLCEGERGDDASAVLRTVGEAVAGTEREAWPRTFLAHGRSLPPEPTAAHPAGGAPGPADVPRSPAVTAVSAFSSYLMGGPPSAALADARRALDHGLDELLLQPPALPAALSVLVGCGHQAEASTRRRSLVADPDRLPRWVGTAVRLTEATGSYAAGDLSAARHALTKQLSELPAHGGQGYSGFRTRLVGLLANVHLDLGDPEAAEALLRRHHHDGHPPTAWHDADVPLARARLRIRAGALSQGVEDLLEVVRRRDAAGVRGPGTLCWRSEGALLLAKAGARDEAVRDARRQVEFAEETGSPQERARALRVWGALAREPASAEALSSAVDLLKGTGHDLETARTTAELGTVLARMGRHGEAVAALSRSAGLAAGQGARDLADRVRLQLVALEACTSHDVSVRGILALTPRERQILIDALLGQANKTIAGRRHITRRTVELHLSSAYRKLGISGRGEFGKILGSPGRWEILVGGE
ncbi:AAA family ATPase [Nocardiopsis sp. M1B1]|uniref:AAA family ATPase n=1 Tax=Nocardiopsis sp. M1B1 TaxID=3450454 RepID=UPI00403A1721